MSARPMFDTTAPAGALPTRIGKYQVEGVLGEGAMGIVYKAIDPQIRRPVAVKTIRRPLLAPDAPDVGALERFRNEAVAAGRLAHPNIVSVYEFGGGDDAGAGELYIAMEYVQGTPLSHLLARGTRLPLPDVMSLMLQLLDALRAAHEQGVWHRDIKPANLLITPDGRLKVTDFGIARIDTSARTMATSTLGSPGYMAPERYTGDAPDARVDIFSCGVLLYELLTGMAPFKGAVDMVMYQVLQVDPPAPSTLPVPCRPPARYDAIVARALAKRAANRYASAQEMIDALVEATPVAIGPALTTQTVALAQQPLPASRAPARVPTVPQPHASQAPVAAPQVPAGDFGSMAWVTSPPGAGTGPQAPAALQPAPLSLPVPLPVPAQVQPPMVPPPGPATSPLPAHWDPATLRCVESALTRQIGPVAKVVVRQAAHQCADLTALVRQVAYASLAPAERKAFVEDLRRASAQAPRRPHQDLAQAAEPADPVPVLGDSPLSHATIERATRVLARQIGPIAPLMAQRAAAAAPSCEAFFVALADAVADQVDRRKLLDALWRAEKA